MNEQENKQTNETTVPTQGTGQTIIVNQPVQPVVKKNGIGTAGFVLAVIGFFFSWIPVLGWIIFILGLIFSFIGVFKVPRGLSIAGLAISFVDLVLLILFVTVLASLFAL